MVSETSIHAEQQNSAKLMEKYQQKHAEPTLKERTSGKY